MLRKITVSLSVIALLSGLAIILAGPGVRAGLWSYMAGLAIIQALALPVIAAAVASLALLILSAFKDRRVILFPLAGLIVSGGAAAVPVGMLAAAQANPMIHDITTDFDNPPAIVAGAAFERANPATYVGAEPVPGSQGSLTVQQAQQQAFPDIEAKVLQLPLEEAVGRAEAALAAMGMEILASGPGPAGNNGSVVIEAVATTLWFGFKDDFVVRLTPAGEGGVRVDVRSKSRVGLSDLGANAERVRAFMTRL